MDGRHWQLEQLQLILSTAMAAVRPQVWHWQTVTRREKSPGNFLLQVPYSPRVLRHLEGEKTSSSTLFNSRISGLSVVLDPVIILRQHC